MKSEQRTCDEIAVFHAGHADHSIIKRQGSLLNAWMTYLKALLDQNVLTLPEIHSWNEKNKSSNTLTNPIRQLGQRQKTLAHLTAAKVFESLIETGQLRVEDFELPTLRLRSTVEEETRNRHDVIVKSHDMFTQQLKFIRVPKGKFRRFKVMLSGRDLDPTNGGIETIELTHDFDVQESLVSQEEWIGIISSELHINSLKNPSHHTDPTSSRYYKARGVSVNPELPVESITWWSMLVFANQYSIRKGLKPAYDLSGIKFDPETSAQAGNLRPKDPRAVLDFGFLKDIYSAEGYRLPTQAEQFYLLTFLFRNDGLLLSHGKEALRLAPSGVVRPGFYPQTRRKSYPSEHLAIRYRMFSEMNRYKVTLDGVYKTAERVTFPLGVLSPARVNEHLVYDLLCNLIQAPSDPRWEPAISEGDRNPGLTGIDPVTFYGRCPIGELNISFPARGWWGGQAHASFIDNNFTEYENGLLNSKTLRPSTQNKFFGFRLVKSINP